MRIVLYSFMASMAMLSAACGSMDLAGKSKKSSGSSDGASAAQPGGAAVVADEQHLPACDAGHEGALYYVTASQDFRACTAGSWQTVSLKGDKGDKGDNGADGQDAETTKALALYKDYKDSVFRITTTCIPKTSLPAGCPANPPNPSVFLGSAFLCGNGEVCTNRHVATCVPSNCYTFQSLTMQALEGTSDTVNSDQTPAAPFFTVTTANAASVKLAPNNQDVAKITGVTGIPASAKVLPLTDKAAKGNVLTLTSTLSMSFPLGFQDLYTDVGHVNTPYIGECDVTSQGQQEGGESGYGCPNEDYAFSTTNDTDHGSSGSPLFDIDGGKVIGITSAGTDGENANFTWAVDAYLIKSIQ